jgi:glycine/D-amino acid oxidase-like deaminating enzyme
VSAGGRADVAVVGAGVMGASTALFLARGGMRCVLLDRAGVCQEASGNNAGTLTMHMTRAALIGYALNGWQMWTTAPQWLGGDPGVSATPGLSLAFTEAEQALLESRARARREQGAPIELISAARAREVEPGLGPGVRAAALCAIDGHVTANLTGHVYRRALVAAAVELREHTAVESIERDGSGYVLRAGEHPVRAARVVLAGGVWLEEMLTWLGLTVPIKTLVNQLAVTERLRPVMRTVTGIANGLLSLKQFANGTVLIGGGWQGIGDRDRHTTEIIPENLIGNLRLARHVVPALAATRVVRTWLGFEAETADAMPIVGALPGRDGAYVIGSVHSGYTSGPYIARLLADRILGREPERALFDPGRLIEAA